jgi:prevent-host-death family protein
MLHMTPDEAKRHLEELIEAAMRGEQVVIANDDQHAVRLIPVTPSPSTHTRQAGTARGMMVIAADFDSPLADLDDYTR